MDNTCPACTGNNAATLASAEEWLSHARVQGGPRTLIAGMIDSNPRLKFDTFSRCSDCGFAFISPRPAPHDLGHFYENYYANGSYIGKSEKKIRRAKSRMKQIKRRSQSGRFLDIGCNVGYMVDAARLAGFDATGIEIDSSAVKAASRDFPECKFSCTTAQDFSERAKPFDVIYCSEVIEHVPDINEFAATLAKLCAPGGTLYLTTPDVRARSKAAFLNWDEVKPPEHLQWFTKKSMTQLLERAGFEVEKFIFNIKPGAGLKLFAKRA